MGALGSMAVIQIAQAVPAAKADGAMRVIMSQLTTARALGIQQRRYMQVRFVTPNTIQTIRQDVNTLGVATGTTLLSAVVLEGGVTYNKITGIPDTPDAFGMATAVNFGTATTIQFSTEGTLIDQTGGPLNGTIVLASPQVKKFVTCHHGIRLDGPDSRIPMERQSLGTGVDNAVSILNGARLFAHRSDHGYIATAVLTVGLLGAAAVLTTGMQRLASSPNDVLATQKAAEAIETVFSARDSHKLTWSQLLRVKGPSNSDGGVFLDDAQPLKTAGLDGLVNTADDQDIESVQLPGVDQLLNTADDTTVTLSNYTRDIKIRDVPNEPVG